MSLSVKRIPPNWWAPVRFWNATSNLSRSHRFQKCRPDHQIYLFEHDRRRQFRDTTVGESFGFPESLSHLGHTLLVGAIHDT